MIPRTKTVVNPHPRRRAKKPVVRVINITHKRRTTLRAFVDIDLFDSIAVYGLQLHAGEGKLWLAWPDCKDANTGGYVHHIRPVAPELHQAIEQAAIEAFFGGVAQ